jgi:hypothetical protein
MIMEVLGHSSIRVTMDIYTFVRLDSQRSAFDRVGDALRVTATGRTMTTARPESQQPSDMPAPPAWGGCRQMLPSRPTRKALWITPQGL